LDATDEGDEGIVKLLLAQDGINVNSKDKNGCMLAATDGHEGVVRLLLVRDDIEVDFKDQNGHVDVAVRFIG
jgi:hypothetical protein